MESGAGIEGIRLDVLREVANIGAGHAASALSQIMTDCRVMISVPDVKACVRTHCWNFLGIPTL